MSLLGLDVGTTGCKAIVFDLEGNALSSAYREYPLLHPQSGWAELDANQVWMKVEESIQEVANQVKANPIKALSISTIYGEKFAVYKDIYPTLRELNHQIRDLSAHGV